MFKIILKALASIFLIVAVLLVLLLAIGIGVGYILYWLLPDIRLDIAMLTGVVAISTLFVVGAIILQSPFSSLPSPDQYNYDIDFESDDDDDDDDDFPYRPTDTVSNLPHSIKNERKIKSKKGRKR